VHWLVTEFRGGATTERQHHLVRPRAVDREEALQVGTFARRIALDDDYRHRKV
jgi:hypothetical protein